MRILMMTNTYAPHVGGVARSVSAYSQVYREMGHDVLVVAPAFDGMEEDEAGVIRIPAIQNFNGSDFSVVLSDSGLLTAAVEQFAPQIIHSHHPFLLGSTALRLATVRSLPLVFTHHTMYEQYTHYAPGDSNLLKRFVAALSTHYANLCDQVFAPSESIATVLAERGVRTPIEVVPTGVRKEAYTGGDGLGFRLAMGLPKDAFIVGHVGRLALEKNLLFLTRSVARFLKQLPQALFLVVGGGPCRKDMRAIMNEAGVGDRMVLTGVLDHPLLTSAYRAMDVFAFASKSETQGMVLTEAMAARVPVVALDAPGVREVVVDQRNGRLLHEESEEGMAAALGWCATLGRARYDRMRDEALTTAQAYSLEKCAARALPIYARLHRHAVEQIAEEQSLWDDAMRRIEAEWTVFRGIAESIGKALISEPEPRGPT